MKAPMPRVFLSHAAGDKQTAQELAEALRGHSLDVLTADSVVAPGENWGARVGDALGRSEAMVVLLTPESVESEWVRRDIEYALTSKRFEHRLIPVVIGGGTAWLGKIPWVLKKLRMVSSSSAARASKEIADVLKKTA